MLQQADSLLASGQYLAARVAYERVLFAADSGSAQAALGKAYCLKQQGLYAATVTFLDGQLAQSYPDSLHYQFRREQVMCAYLAGQFDNALSLLDRMAYLHPQQAVTPLLLGIKVLSLNELQRWPEADLSFRKLQTLTAADTIQLSPYAKLPQLKSEAKAERLSTFIPGAGQLYAGRPGEAVLSLLVQSAGLYFGITSFWQHYYLSAWGVGAGLFGSFHAGGVRRAVVLVRERNRKVSAAFNAQAKQQVLELLK